MELDGLFSSSKWRIIEEISLEPQSPLQLADKMATSVANISQQMRLLEVAGLVKKRRVSERARGKPRVIFSLNNDFCYLLTAAEGFAKKRILNLDEYHLALMKILMLDEINLHEELIEFYFKIRPHLDKVDAVFIQGRELIVLVKNGYNGPKEFSMLKGLKLSLEQSKPSNLKAVSAPGVYAIFVRRAEAKKESDK